MNEPQTYSIVYDRIAFQSLREITAYIQTDSGDERAADWLRNLQGSISKLRLFPHAFPTVGTRLGRVVRSKVVMSHRVFYIIDEVKLVVRILDVVHTARETRLARYRS